MRVLKEEKVVNYHISFTEEELETLVRAMGTVGFGYGLYQELDNLLKGEN